MNNFVTYCLNNPTAQFLFFFIITILFFFILLQFVDPEVILRTLSSANPLYLVLCILIMFSYPTSIAWRWKFLLKRLDYDITFWESLCVVMGTWPIMSVTPLKSGDLIKGIYVRDKIPVAVATGSIITEKILDLSSLILFSIFGSLILSQWYILLIASIVVVLISGILMVVRYGNIPFADRFKTKYDSLFLSVKVLLAEPGSFAFILIFSLVKWLLVFWQTDLCFKALGVDIPFSFMIAALPIAIFIGLIPISISGMGTRDAALIYLFSGFTSPGICLSVGILYSIFGYWLLSLIGLPFFRHIWRKGFTS